MIGVKNMETSALWLRCFGEEVKIPNIQRLVVSLRDTRERIKLLTDRISSTLPGLTLHDVSHLDALWEVADIIAGENFELNPLEAYVFGCAVLLHDACLCFEAYEGGQEAVKQTVVWQDIRQQLVLSAKLKDVDREADFLALRILHAKQAERLATYAWNDEDGTQTYVIDDSDLREHYGSLIGKIAGSHHWEIGELATEFKDPRPPAAFISHDWSVDSLKIACLLRVADAGHLDGRRGPTFLLKILQMNSLSRDHWLAQNRLGRISISQDNPKFLVVSSTHPFTRTESRAWWVAFDAVTLLNKELENCNELLGTCNRLTFARKRVAGAGRATKLVRFIETEGWEPTDTNVHVSDVTALVSNLGGENLYGKNSDRLEIALRELIQNGADAILARRRIDKSHGSGQLTIRLKRKQNAYILQVDDDGVGMSKYTMIKDLLDFGKSFWASQRVVQEFPSLLSSGYLSIGQFGIGFFSIFMAAEKVRVFSRRFDAGLNEVRCLSFDHGVSLRPVLSTERPTNLGMNTSTRVELELKAGILDDPKRVRIRSNEINREELFVPISDYVASMVSGLNVPVIVDVIGIETRVHVGFPPDIDQREQWLRTITYESAGVNAMSLPIIQEAVPRLREIRDEKGIYGLAAISVSNHLLGSFLSLMSIGGLATPHHPQQNDSFIGQIDCFPADARRSPGEFRAPKFALQSWATEQADLLGGKHTSDIGRVYACYSLCHFGHDPKDVLGSIFVLNNKKEEREIWPLAELVAKLDNGNRLVFPSVMYSKRTLDSHALIRRVPHQNNFFQCLVINNGEFNDAELENSAPKNSKSLIGVIHRTLKEFNRRPNWILHEKTYQSLIGPGDYLEVKI